MHNSSWKRNLLIKTLQVIQGFWKGFKYLQNKNFNIVAGE